MKNQFVLPENISKNTVDCIGTFNPADEFCYKYCSLKIRCAIEQNQINRMDAIDEYIYTNGYYNIPF
jgi:hypothetical protein